MTLEEMDAELAAVTANLRRLRNAAIVEYTEMLAEESNPYTRELLLQKLERFRAMAVD